jgi:uncharacterized protein (TIGR02271 family)
MATMQRDEILQHRGADLLDRDGDKIGTIEEIYLDAETAEPEWALVNTGLFGTKSSFVPIQDVSREGESLRVPFAKSQVKDAPKMDPDGQLSQREEAELYRHYGLEYSELASGSGLGAAGGGEATGRATGSGREGTRGGAGEAAQPTARDETGGVGGEAAQSSARGETGGGSDSAMTRSEEELRVGKTERESGRARLRKYVETEDVEETVPVRREEARVEREPITDDNVDQAMAGPDISEDEHEVALHEEEVVAEKRAVPKERIRLEKDAVTDEREVSDTVRKERIDVEDSDR